MATPNPWDLPLLEYSSKAAKDLRRIAGARKKDAKRITNALDRVCAEQAVSALP